MTDQYEETQLLAATREELEKMIEQHRAEGWDLIVHPMGGGPGAWYGPEGAEPPENTKPQPFRARMRRKKDRAHRS